TEKTGTLFQLWVQLTLWEPIPIPLRTKGAKVAMSRFLPTSRRAFLRAMGVGAAVLPLLEVEEVLGQAAGPKRAFILVWTNGMMNREQMWPSQGVNPTLPAF